MAIISHFLAASTLDSPFTKEALEAFMKDLLDERMVRLPAGILVGEARAFPEEHLIDFWDYAPGFLISHYSLEEQELPPDLLWYPCDEKQAFLNALHQFPLEEKDCCIFFVGVSEQLAAQPRRWDGAALYLLTHPFPIAFLHDDGMLCQTDLTLAHFFVLFSERQGTMGQKSNPLEPLLKRHFGSALLMRESFPLLGK